MNRVLKIFCALLLALALPMQGYAAATMFSCSTEDAHSAGPTADNLSMHHAGQDAGEAAHHQHASMRHGFNPHDSSHHSQSGQHAHSSCSTCAACCVGIALTPAVPGWHPPNDTTASRSIFPAVSFSGHVPPGIDRPPRAILA